jgi:TPR repeat protein
MIIKILPPGRRQLEDRQRLNAPGGTQDATSTSLRRKCLLAGAALALAAFLVVSTTAAARADFDTGVAAFDGGDFTTAYNEWLPLAAGGDPFAQRNIGHLYRLGLGVPQDFAVAFNWYQRAADQGLVRAQANVANMMLRGQGVDQDPEGAVSWFHRAASAGHAVSQFNIGQMYRKGHAVPQDMGRALGWFQLAADAGHERSIELVAIMTAEGVAPANDDTLLEAPFEQDAGRSAKFPQTPEPQTREPRISDEAMAAAVSEGLRAYQGKDYTTALRTWLPLAEAGNRDAQFFVGGLYMEGAGVPEDQVRAHAWWRLSADQGHSRASEFLEVIVTIMTADQLSAARDLAGELGAGASGRAVAQARERIASAEEGAAVAAEEIEQVSVAGRLTDLAIIDEDFVAIKDANVRERPNIGSARTGRLAKGERVTVLGKVANAEWYLVAKNDEQLGYVFAPLLALGGSNEAFAAAAPAKPPVEVNRDAVAVIIGNTAYKGDIPKVDYAYNDADAMKRYVIDVLGYRVGNLIDLRDATLGDLRRVFGTKEDPRGQLLNRLRPGRSDVVVFYSGHGVPGLRDKRGYLLPVDGDPNLAENTAYPLDVLLANLENLPAHSVQLFLDACFSGNSAGGMLQAATSGIGISARPSLAAGENFIMLTAATDTQVASWDRDAKLGLFTKHLLDALNGEADEDQYGNGDGMITLSEVKTYLDEEMTFQAARRFDRQQDATMVGGGETVLVVAN